MTTQKEALRIALEALEYEAQKEGDIDAYRSERDAIKKALAQPEREWVGLTVEEASEIYNSKYNEYAVDLDIADFLMIYMAIEAKLKEKNID